MMRVLIFRDNDIPVWIGQALEHDLCVQGATPDDVRRRMKLQIEYYNGSFGWEFTPVASLDDVPPAPQEFMDKWMDMDFAAIRDTIELP